jgi:hypothetical protein
MSIEAMKLALEALRTLHDENMDYLTRNKLGGENNQCMVFARETITALRQSIEQAKHYPPECQTEAEKTAYAFGWWKALESVRAQKQEPVAWFHTATNQAFTSEPPPSLKAQCKVLVFADAAPPPRQPLTSQERDAHRWRFLMENSYDSKSVTQFHVWEHSWEPHSKTGEPTEWKQRVRGIALIDFIDRAIEAAHGIKGEA